MPERKIYNGNTRQIIDFNGVVSSVGQLGLYCIDNGVFKIIRYLISSRGLWRSTYAIDYFDGGYNCPDAAQFKVVSDAIGEFLSGDDMSCDLVTSLSGIEDAIRDLRFVCGESANTTAYDGTRWSRGGTVGQNPSSFGQPGDLFSSLGEYETSKCNKAAWLVDGFIQAVGNVGTLSLAEAIAGTVGLAGISIAFFSNPPVAILAALAIAVGVSFSLSSYCSLVQEYLQDNRQTLICQVYNSAYASDAYDAIDAMLDAAIAYSGLAVGQEAFALVCMAFVDVDTISQIYGDSDVLQSAGGANCSGCSVYSVSYGVENELALADIGSVDHPTLGAGIQYVSVSFSVPVTLSAIAVLSGSWGGQTNCFQWVDGSGYHAADNFSSQSGVTSFELANNYGTPTPYSVGVGWSID